MKILIYGARGAELIAPRLLVRALAGYGQEILAFVRGSIAMPLMKKLGISGTCRASFYIYNTFDDIDKLVEGLKKIRGKFE